MEISGRGSNVTVKDDLAMTAIDIGRGKEVVCCKGGIGGTTGVSEFGERVSVVARRGSQ